MVDVSSALSRRRLLKVGLGAGVVAGAGASAVVWDILRVRSPRAGLRALADDDARVAEAVADAYFPRGTPFGKAAAELDVADVLDAYMSALYARERRGLLALLRGLERWPQLTFGGGAFSALSLADRQRVLRAFDDSTLPERRLLGALLRQVCCMALFEEDAVLAALGHRHGCGLPIFDDLDAGIG